MPNSTTPHSTALNWTMRSQTKACTAKSLCEICDLLKYAAQSRNSLPMFRGNLLVPPSTVKKSKRVTRAQLQLTDTILFFGVWPSSNFFKHAQHFKCRVCFRFQENKHLSWWTTSELFSITGHHRHGILFYVPEKWSSPRVVTEKNGYWKLKNKVQGSNRKPGPIHKLRSVKRAMNSPTYHTTDMTQKSTTHVLKFFIPLTNTICGENYTVYGFK
jgi:hypothetical protein